jgi:general secretion pathway protein A
MDQRYSGAVPQQDRQTSGYAAEFGASPPWKPYYGFTENPFSLRPETKYFYPSQSHTDALESLQQAIALREGFFVVTGDAGTGKTTLCRALLDRVDRKTFTALLAGPFQSEEALLRAILEQFGLVSSRDAVAGSRPPSSQELVNAVHDFLRSLAALGAHAVLVVDEAQRLTSPMLEHVRLLSNFEPGTEKLLQVLLVGQPDLLPLLRSPELRQLDQRVSIRQHLLPLAEHEVSVYVPHRLAIGHGTEPVAFSPEALRAVYDYSAGIPRSINMLCDGALSMGSEAQKSTIDEELVIRAAENLGLKSRDRSFFRRLLGRRRSH